MINEEQDRLYLSLKGARERMCIASGIVPPRWQQEVKAATHCIDLLGSSLCPQQWSRFDQPEYPGENP